MASSHRYWIFAPGILLAGVLAAYSAYWFLSARAFDARLGAANGREVVPGVVFAFAEKRVSGFPFRIDAVLEGVTIASRSPAGETAWRAERVAIHRLAYQSDRYVFEADGLQAISWPGADGKTHLLHLRPGLARASAVLQGTRLARVDIDLVRVLAQDVTRGAAPEREFTAARAQMHFVLRPDRTIDLAARIDGARIGNGYAAVLGRTVTAALTGKIESGEALDRLLGGNQNPHDAFEEWRQAGGRIAVDRLELTSDLHNQAVLSGEFTLNAMHRLEGSLKSMPAGNAPALSLVIMDGKIQN